jgi:alkylation response protein AidB-like acyl-CoA dehydrogenase
MTMRLDPDQDALEFGAGVRDLFADAADSTALRAAWDSEDGRIPGLWKRLADVGVLGAVIPEASGGLGLDARSVLPLLVETGRAAIPEPVVETMVGAVLLAAVGGSLAERWLPAIADGSAVIAVGLGNAELVSGAQWADLLLLEDRDGSVHAVEAERVSIHPAASVDGGMRLARVEWQPSADTAIAAADAARGFDFAVFAVAAQLTGLADAMLDLSVEYALQREQFGKPIGSFQAIKHQLADVYVASGFAKPVVARAAWSVSQDLPTRWRDVSHAKHAASRAASGAARTALQVHAGIGYTFEHDLHMWMKRTWSLTSLWGTAAWHRIRVADAVLDNVDNGDV